MNDDAPVLAQLVAQAVHRLHIDAAAVHRHHAGGFNQLAAERIVAEQLFFRHTTKLFKALFRKRGGKIEIIDFGNVVCANNKPLVGRDIVGVVDIDMIAKLRHIAEKRIGVIVAVGLFQRIHDIGVTDLLFLRSLVLQRQHNVADGHVVRIIIFDIDVVNVFKLEREVDSAQRVNRKFGENARFWRDVFRFRVRNLRDNGNHARGHIVLFGRRRRFFGNACFALF